MAAVKKAFIIFATLLLLCLGACGGNDADVTSAPDQSKVKANGYFGTDGQRHFISRDKEGRIISRMCHAEDNSLLYTVIISYEADGTYIREYDGENVLVSESFCTEAAGTVYSQTYKGAEKTKYTYGKNGAITAKTVYKNDIPVLNTVFDESGKQIKSISYDVKGEVSTYKTYSYNDAGRNVRTDIYNGKDALISSVVYEYNDKGYYSSVTTSDGEGLTTDRTVYEYDENGRQTGELKYKYQNGKAVSYEKWVIDSNGKRSLEGTYDA